MNDTAGWAEPCTGTFCKTETAGVGRKSLACCHNVDSGEGVVWGAGICWIRNMLHPGYEMQIPLLS